MTDPVYLKLKEDAVIVLTDLWRTLFPERKRVCLRTVAKPQRDVFRPRRAH